MAFTQATNGWKIKRVDGNNPVFVKGDIFSFGYACHDPEGRLRCVIERRGRWRLWRVTYNRAGDKSLGGLRSFKTLKSALDFATRP
jgi:hypothetical protein